MSSIVIPTCVSLLNEPDRCYEEFNNQQELLSDINLWLYMCVKLENVDEN